MSPLLEDDVLVGMLAELAESVPVPGGGAEAALAAIRSGRSEAAPVVDLDEARARRRRRFGTVVGAAAAAVIVIGVVAAHGSSSSGTLSTQSSAGLPVAAAAASAAPPAPGAQSLERGATAAGTTAAGATAAGATAAGATTSTTKAGTDTSGATNFQGQSGALASPAALPSATAAAANGGGGAPSVDADRVIRTGDVNLQVAKGNVAATVPELEGAASGLGGFLDDSQTQQADPKTGGSPSASVTLRVPAAKFETLLTRVQALGTVLSSTTSGQDVTSQYVDLAARLTALQTSRETYLVILSKAATVNDTLAVQQRLDDLQQQIEQLQGQQNQLAAQSDLGTLTVEVSQPAPTPKAVAPPAKAKTRSGLSAAFHTAGDRFRRGTEAVIASLGTIALLLIAGLVVLVAGRFGRRYYLRRTV